MAFEINGLGNVLSAQSEGEAQKNAEIVVNPDLVKECLDSSSKSALPLSNRSITSSTDEEMTFVERHPLVIIIGFSILFLVLLGAAVALGLFGFIPVACFLIVPMLGAIGGVIVGIERLCGDTRDSKWLLKHFGSRSSDAQNA